MLYYVDIIRRIPDTEMTEMVLLRATGDNDNDGIQIRVPAELRRPEIQDARSKAKDLFEVYGDIAPRIKQCVTVKCYSTIFPHDKYQRNAVKFAFEKILELID